MNCVILYGHSCVILFKRKKRDVQSFIKFKDERKIVAIYYVKYLQNNSHDLKHSMPILRKIVAEERFEKFLNVCLYLLYSYSVSSFHF